MEYKYEDHLIHYSDSYPKGNPAVLLIHGLGVDGSRWQPQIDVLGRAGFRPIAPDLPGFGKSAQHGHLWTLENVSCILSGLIEDLNVSPVILVGTSMGGVVSQRFVLDYPKHVSRLVLINTFACLRPDRLGEYLYLWMRFGIVRVVGPKAQARFAARRIFPAADQQEQRRVLSDSIRKTHPQAYRSAMREMARFDVRSRLHEINVPVLVISGENDNTINPKIQVKLVEGIPDSRHVTIPGAGHAAIVTHAELVSHHILNFITLENEAARLTMV